VPGLILAPWPDAPPSALALLCVSGVVGGMLGRVTLTIGIAHLGAATAGPLQGTYPFWSFAIAALFIGEIVTPLHLLGGTLVVGGVAVLMAWGRAQPVRLARNPRLRRYMVFPLAATLCYAVGDSSARVALLQAPYPLFGAAFSYVAATVALLLGYAALPHLWPHLRPCASALAWFLVAGSVQGLAVLALFAALSVGQVIQVSPIIGAQPLFVLLWSAALLSQREVIRLSTAVGAVAVVAGVATIALARAGGAGG
jgi:drug/metabolite transporter (DMT)-like permease